METYSRLRAAVGVTEPWKAVEVDGVNLAYNDDGTGLVVICLHAIGHGAGDYSDLRVRLRNQYRVIAVDFPGHGNSGDDTKPVSTTRYSELLALFLNKLKIDKVVIIGNSIGGATAIRYAFANPPRVLGLILENPGGLDPMDRLTQIFTKFMVRIFSGGMARAWWYPKAFADFYRVLLPNKAAHSQRAKIVASAWEIAPGLVQAWQSFGEAASDLREIVPSISCPVLFTWASRDPLVQFRRCLPAIKKFPNAQIEMFNAGHAPHLENPTEFEQSVRKFLADIQNTVVPNM